MSGASSEVFSMWCELIQLATLPTLAYESFYLAIYKPSQFIRKTVCLSTFSCKIADKGVRRSTGRSNRKWPFYLSLDFQGWGPQTGVLDSDAIIQWRKKHLRNWTQHIKIKSVKFRSHSKRSKACKRIAQKYLGRRLKAKSTR